MTVTVPPSGFVDLTRRFRRVRLEPGENITFLFDEGHGTGVQDQYPVLTKQVEFRARRGAIPRRDRGCILFTGPNAGPDLPCVAPCPPEPRLQFSTYCEGAGQLLPPPRFAIASRAARGGGVRLTHLEVGDLAFPPPFSDPAIAVFCNGRGCPFGARFFARPPGGVQRIESFGRSVLRPGTVIEIWIVKGNFIGRAQRYEVNRGGLAASSLCIHPTELTPRACPTG